MSKQKGDAFNDKLKARTAYYESLAPLGTTRRGEPKNLGNSIKGFLTKAEAVAKTYRPSGVVNMKITRKSG